MAVYDDELLAAARVLIHRPTGRRGRLPSARVRRSISTTYYALFHFLLDEVGKLWPLGNDITFVPGHGPTSTFGQERKTNSYVSDYALS